MNDKLILENINLSIPRGSLVIVVGRVGAGKSSILSAILGEMVKAEGDLRVRSDSKAYVSQQPWIQNLTVKKNILFGKEENELWYKDVSFFLILVFVLLSFLVMLLVWLCCVV